MNPKLKLDPQSVTVESYDPAPHVLIGTLEILTRDATHPCCGIIRP